MSIEAIIPFIFAGFFILALVIRAFGVLLHELGHALPALKFTKQEVTVFIGTYGDKKKSYRLTVGKLTIWFRYNPIFWQKGVCFHKIPPATNQHIIITLGGPVISLLLAAPSCYLAFFFDSHGALKLITFFFMISASIDFLFNIIPRRTPITLHDGRTIYNDGRNLAYLIRYKKFEKKYTKAYAHFNKQEHETAARLFTSLMDDPIQHPNAYRMAIFSNIRIRQYEKALQQHQLLGKKFTLDANDYNNLGLIMGFLSRHEECRTAFEELLSLDPDHIIGLNNLGYMLVFTGKYEEALPILDKAISLAPEVSHAYANRGWCKIRAGLPEEGLPDIEKALSLNPNDAYIYRNLGIYHMHKGNKQQALENFEKARVIDRYTHLLDDLIRQLPTTQTHA